MHQAETFRGTVRKRESAIRNRQAPDIKTSRVDGRQNATDRKRVETVVETLATLRGRGETVAEVAHDARNMVTALGLYCDLLEEPGVLATPFMHYGQELRLVAVASRRLVEKLVAIEAQHGAEFIAQTAAQAAALPVALAASEPETAGIETCGWGLRRDASTLALAYPGPANPSRRWDLLPAVPVANLAAELLANRNLLAALAGPTIALTVHAEGGAWPVRLTSEDLTRVLVNLVKNATEAMPSGGRIHIGLREEPPAQGAAACLLLTVEDNGPGIPQDALETIFASGYTAHGKNDGKAEGQNEDQNEGLNEGPNEGSYGNWGLSHRGLGLTITRSIVEGAGGRITAGNREHGGARFVLELPLRKAN